MIAEEFRKAFQETKVIHNNTTWLGRPALKCVTDAWVYQELIYKLKPEFIIETGTHRGGGSLFLASMCDLMNHGKVITVELNDIAMEPLIHERITQLKGSSTDETTLKKIKEIVGDGSVIVILDSDHSYEHVTRELQEYSQFVKEGYYLIVEDTHMPYTKKAVDDFLVEHQEYEVDMECEKFLFTFNPGGFLRRIK